MKQVVVIDDDPEMAEVYKLLFTPFIDKGILDLKLFTDSRKFIEWFPSHSPDLIMTDLSMPFIDGPDVCDFVRRSNQTIPTYLISGHDHRDYTEVMRKVKINKFLTKPLDFKHLLNCLFEDLSLKLQDWPDAVF